MSKAYYGKSGKIYMVSDQAAAGGGEGKIHLLDGIDGQVAKIFKPDRRSAGREEKLLYMIQYQLNQEQFKQITWPQDVLYEDGKFVGYIMPRLKKSQNLNVVYSEIGRKCNLRHRFVIAYNLCAAVDTVHTLHNGQVCGDLNPQNICVNLNPRSEEKLRVTLVDTDSYHIRADGKTYRCEVGLGNFIAPELQRRFTKGADLKTMELPTYTKETDLFALAVHIFSLLMNGCHPFACAKKAGSSYEHTMGQMNGTGEDSIVLPRR